MTSTSAAGSETGVARGTSARSRQLRRLLRKPNFIVGSVIVFMFLAVTVLAPVLTPYDPTQGDFLAAQLPPVVGHPLGTDQYGRDLLTRVLYGSRTALLAILVADGIALVAGSALGLAAGFYGGATDSIIMRVVDVLLAFPYLLLALIIVAALGPSLFNAMVAIGVVYTPQYARLLRGKALSIRQQEFVQSARALGARDVRVMLRHVLPNSLVPILVTATLQAGTVIVETAGLSFLGLGAQPPTPDWGAILADGQTYFLTSWWIATFPGLAILIVVLGFNLVGDALRDTLETG